jgi:cytochrome c-type biogenesis protein CcmH
MQMRTGNPIAAERNLERVVAMTPDNAQAWDRLGQAHMDLADGKLTPQARAAFEKAISLNPKVVAPRFFLADDAINKGRTAEGIAALRAMLPDLAPEQKEEVNQRIAEAEKGPQEAFDPAANPAIQAMVAGLAERLKTNPNDPEGWVMLVRSYSQLKDTAKLNEALADARRYFKDRPRELSAIEAAASGRPAQ